MKDQSIKDLFSTSNLNSFHKFSWFLLNILQKIFKKNENICYIFSFVFKRNSENLWNHKKWKLRKNEEAYYNIIDILYYS
jgi:hypothetical protein